MKLDVIPRILDEHPEHDLPCGGGLAAWEQGGHVYVCGDGLRMAPAVRQVLLGLHRDRTGEDGAAWPAELEERGRYQQDVFA
ncbi:hypothetical protein [Nonomuraea sp. NPDC049504]|uniref:hypothetical protein n=1 Tax=Nonomuraea sp. NPDC049504 TaxID=3154729 RepID=UPI00342A75E7